MFQAEIPVGICRYKENEKGESFIYLDSWIHAFKKQELMNFL